MKNQMVFFIKLLFIVTIGYATTINIPADYSAIQAGIDATVNGDTVLVQPGTYIENINFNGKNIVVGSLFMINADTSYISTAVIDGDSSGSVVIFTNGEDSTATLIGFTITNGYNHPGGGIYISDSSPTIRHCTITENIAEWANGIGGGLYLSNSSTKVIRCKISNNTALGMDSNNGWGGGIACSNSNIEIINSRINNNFATSSYGGVGTMDSYIKIINCEISNNSVGSSGAGLGFQDSYPTLINNTITRNSSSFGGSGFYYIRSNPIIINTIIWDNNATSGPDNIDGWGGEVHISYSDIQGGWQGEGNIDVDPLFCNPGTSGDYTLAENSPCFGSGENGANMGAFGIGCDAKLSLDNELFPTSFVLNQNYPNPFNPTTTLQYELSHRSDVQITIYDLLGRKVTTLVSETQEAGYRSVIWNATNDHGKPVSAGVYLYQIQAGEFVQTKKMVLLK